MKKIIFGITSLTLGGAERVLVDLANKMSERFDKLYIVKNIQN